MAKLRRMVTEVTYIWYEAELTNEQAKAYKEGDEINKWDDLENTIILFSDSYDVIFNDTPNNIIRKFREFNRPLVFSAEKTCWPNQELSDRYPIVDGEYKFLNSG